MASPTIVGSVGTADNAASTGYIVNYPAGITAGELLLAMIHCRAGGSTIASPPAGWNLIATQNAQYSQWSYWRAAVGTETGTVTFTGSGSGVNSTNMIRISGADTSSPVSTSATSANASSTSSTFATITPTHVDTLIIAWGGTSGSVVTANTWNNSLTEVFDHGTGSGTTVRVSWGGQKAWPTANVATGAMTVTLSGAVVNSTQTLAIKSGGGGAAATSFIFPTETVQRMLMRR